MHAHGAGVVPPGDHPSGRAGQYFIVGTSQKMPPSWLSDSVNLYSSTDLQHWSFEAEIFHSSQITTPWQPTPEPYRMERPKILYNQKTSKYVMWFHLDDAAFSMGMVGVATADTIRGPYTYGGPMASGVETWACTRRQTSRQRIWCDRSTTSTPASRG